MLLFFVFAFIVVVVVFFQNFEELAKLTMLNWHFSPGSGDYYSG